MVDHAQVDKAVDVATAVVKIIGDTAIVAMKAGDIALPILQDIGLFVPPVGDAANYLAVALPYITKVAQYAPEVQSALQNNKSMIEAAVDVGDSIMSPLFGLLQEIPSLAGVHAFFGDLDAFFKANEYSPQDWRLRFNADA